MAPVSTLVLEKVPPNPFPSSTCPKLVNESPSHMTQELSKLLPLPWDSQQVSLCPGPSGDLPGGSVVATLSFQCRFPGFNSWSGN